MDHPKVSTPRELSDAAINLEAEQLVSYLKKPGNRGASFWLATKGFSPADRLAILETLLGLEDGAA